MREVNGRQQNRLLAAVDKDSGRFRFGDWQQCTQLGPSSRAIQLQLIGTLAECMLLLPQSRSTAASLGAQAGMDVLI